MVRDHLDIPHVHHLDPILEAGYQRSLRKGLALLKHLFSAGRYHLFLYVVFLCVSMSWFPLIGLPVILD